MHRWSNCNHDKFKKKAVEEEVDVSVYAFFLVASASPSNTNAGRSIF